MSEQKSNLFEDLERASEAFASFETEFSKSPTITTSNTKTQVISCTSPWVSAKSPISRRKSFENLKNEVENFEKDRNKPFKQGEYLGVLTKKSAEEKIKKYGQFALYHHLTEYDPSISSPEEPAPVLYPNIVYLDSYGKYRHYPIIQLHVANPDWKVLYQVKTHIRGKNGREAPPTFTSIVRLVDHYTKFAYGYQLNEDGSVRVDIFPVL